MRSYCLVFILVSVLLVSATGLYRADGNTEFDDDGDHGDHGGHVTDDRDDGVLGRLLSWLDSVAGDDAMVAWADGRPPSRFFRDVANQHLVLQRDSTGHRGVFVSDHVETERVAVAVPLRCLMSSASARDPTRAEPLASLIR